MINGRIEAGLLHGMFHKNLSNLTISLSEGQSMTPSSTLVLGAVVVVCRSWDARGIVRRLMLPYQFPAEVARGLARVSQGTGPIANQQSSLH